MDAFEKARAKYEKNRERQSRVPQVQIAEKREEPKPVAKREGPMVVCVSGPVELVFEVDYAGTLMAGQLTPQGLTDLFKKHLSVLGRVRCP